jgi:hypothetical protein
MIAANNSFVNTTMEESLPEIAREASQNSFVAPPALQLPLLPCPNLIIDNKDAPITNVEATIAANSNNNHLLPDTAKPPLPAAPRSKDAAENVTAGHLHSNIAIEIGAIEARRDEEHPGSNLDEHLDATNNLDAETKHVLISTNTSLPNSNREDHHPSGTLEIVIKCLHTPDQRMASPMAAQPVQDGHQP